MIRLPPKEQQDDDNKKEYCNKQLDQIEDSIKNLKQKMSDLDASMAAKDDQIATLTSEIEALEDSIKALDKSVAEATENRQTEHKEFNDLVQSDTAAKELLGFAKNRLNKFYNPKLYKPAPKRVLSSEDSIVVGMGGTLAPTPPPGGIADTGITVFADVSAHGAPPPPPETFGAYSKKG